MMVQLTDVFDYWGLIDYWIKFIILSCEWQ
jgi:hypothetical protein